MGVNSSQENENNEVSTSDNRKVLYKYTNMDFIESCILNGVYASKIDAVNDPYESDGIKYPHLYRICCMTKSSKKMLLWAYYTNHKECCVEFDTSGIDGKLLRGVKYDKEFLSHADMSLDEIYSSLYKKGYEWRHENEYRAVFYRRCFDEAAWTIKEDNIYLKAPVKAVTFGLFADRDLVRYKSALEVLIRNGIQGKKCKLQPNNYALEYDKQFDLAVELEKTINKINNLKKDVLTPEEEKALKWLVRQQGVAFAPVTFEKVVMEAELNAAVKSLLDKGVLVLQYTQEKDDTFSFSYTLTNKGATISKNII